MWTAKREEQLKLLSFEQGALMRLPSVSTISFFNGDGEGARVSIRRRLAEVMQANPWLDGRLEKAEGGETVLMCQKPGKPAEGDDALPAMLFRMERPEEGGVFVSRAMSYDHEVVEADLMAAGLLVKGGHDSVGRDEPLFKVSFLLDSESPKDRFALVVSMSHVVADAYTFYYVHNMLSKTGAVVALNPNRNFNARAAIESAFGRCMFNDPDPGFVFNFFNEMLLSKLLGPGTKTAMYFLDEEWIAREKRAATAGGSVQFVSTNDVVTCTFLRATRASLPVMFVDARGRVEGVERDCAGCYYGSICYRPADYAAPALIRESVDPKPQTLHPKPQTLSPKP